MPSYKIRISATYDQTVEAENREEAVQRAMDNAQAGDQPDDEVQWTVDRVEAA